MENRAEVFGRFGTLVSQKRNKIDSSFMIQVFVVLYETILTLSRSTVQ